MSKIEKICPKCGANYINICIQCHPVLVAISTGIFMDANGKIVKMNYGKNNENYV